MPERLKLADMRERAKAYGMFIHKRFGGYFVLSHFEDDYTSDCFSGSLRDISHFMSGLNHRPAHEAREHCVVAVAYSASKYTTAVSDALFYATHGTADNYQHRSIDSEEVYNAMYKADSKMRRLFDALKEAPKISGADRVALLTQVAQITAEAMERIVQIMEVNE
jgi:hypothetical protein